MDKIATILIIAGLLLIVIGIFWSLGSKFLPLGKLPGDISIKKENFSFYFPLTTSIIISVVLSLLFWIYIWLRK